MKIIDIFNKIASGKDVPRKIKYGGKIWEYKVHACDYRCVHAGRWLFTYLFDTTHIKNFINSKVKIIEEDKKISFEKIEELTCGTYDFETQTINLLIKNQKRLIDEINKIKENR